MSPEALRDTVKRQPFEPFRLVTTDGASYEIRHPDLVMVGIRTLMVGLTGQPGQTFFERSVQIDLLHVVRLEPLEASQSKQQNGPA
jgi:hypothetical protein